MSQTPGWMRQKRGLLYPLLCNDEIQGSTLREPPSSADTSVLCPNQHGVSQLGRTWDTPLPTSVLSLRSECISHPGQEEAQGKVTALQAKILLLHSDFSHEIWFYALFSFLMGKIMFSPVERRVIWVCYCAIFPRATCTGMSLTQPCPVPLWPPPCLHPRAAAHLRSEA